jgi:hypothetical protein
VHKAPSQNPETRHFTLAQGVKAAQCLWFEMPESAKAKVLANEHEANALISLPRACKQAARAEFKRLMEIDGMHARQIERINAKSFKRLAYNHMNSWLSSQSTEMPKKRRRHELLSEAEIREAALILATPQQQGSSFKHWRSVNDCKTHDHPKRARFAQLCAKAKLKDEAFGERLMQKCPNLLHRVVADKAGQLNPTTLKARQKAAAIWGGREPWKVLVHDRVAEQLGIRMTDVDDPRLLPLHMRSEPWDWEYYRQFTFMLDATTFDDSKGGIHSSQKVFCTPKQHYPPELVQPDKVVNCATKLMVYYVIHGYEGPVAGPFLMYTGSKTPHHPSSDARHRDNFPHWCALYLFFLGQPQRSLQRSQNVHV